MNKKLFIFIITILYVFNSFGQEESIPQINSKGFVISIGPSFPLADFGDDDLYYDYYVDYLDQRELGAGTGIALNVDYILPLSDNGFGLFFGIGVNYHGVSRSYKDDFEYEFEFDDSDIIYQKFFNIPIASGVNFTHHFDEKVAIFGNLGLVANILKITDREIEDRYYFGADGKLTTSFDPKTNIGMRLNGGVILNNKWYLSVNYVDAGRTSIKYEEKYRGIYGGERFRHTIKSKISYLNLLVGIRI